MSPEDIEDWFRDLKREGWEPNNRSPEDEGNNCIAHAAGDEENKWDPNNNVDGRYWPDDIPCNLELETFVRLYEKECGYLVCDNGNLEDGFEKIAIYWNFNPEEQKVEVTHAARQLPSGKWISKLGPMDDIIHNTVAGVGGLWPAYGTVAKFMKRPKPSTSSTLYISIPPTLALPPPRDT
jgi:hypothetical protein